MSLFLSARWDSSFVIISGRLRLRAMYLFTHCQLDPPVHGMLIHSSGEAHAPYVEDNFSFPSMSDMKHMAQVQYTGA